MRRRSTGPYGEYLLKKFDLFREEERRPPADGAGVGPETRSGCEQDTSAASAGVHTKEFSPFILICHHQVSSFSGLVLWG